MTKVLLSELYRHVGDLPRQIPIFPLRRTILLPRAVLPLSIFEPRYLAMVDEAISGNRIIGIVQPERSTVEDEQNEDDGRPLYETDSPASNEAALRKTGCMGRITGFQELDDGRMMISLTGIARFHLLNDVPSGRAYRICDVDCAQFASDLEEGAGESEVDRDTLMEVFKAYLETHDLEADWSAITKTSTEFLVNSLSVVSPYGQEEKQALLEAPSLRERAEILVALAEMELASGESGAGGGSTIQ